MTAPAAAPLSKPAAAAPGQPKPPIEVSRGKETRIDVRFGEYHTFVATNQVPEPPSADTGAAGAAPGQYETQLPVTISW